MNLNIPIDSLMYSLGQLFLIPVLGTIAAAGGMLKRKGGAAVPGRPVATAGAKA